MKKHSIFLFIAFLTLNISCEKTDEPVDDIRFNEIDKVIIGENRDTIGNLIFEIYNENNSLQARLLHVVPDIPIDCDCGSEVIINPETGNVNAYKEGESISGNYNSRDYINWGNNYSLDNFKGGGNLYIGSMSLNFSTGEMIYKYSWIKINLSQNSDTLRIIETAYNNTENKPILAGQKE